MVRFYAGSTGLKTGFTAKAGYCLSSTAQRDGMELVAVVMGSETSQDRFSGCKAMLDYGFANYALVYPTLPEQYVSVKLGTEGVVKAELGSTEAILIDKSQKNTISNEITLSPQVSAPVVRGQRLGVLTIKSGQQVLKQIPLIAGTGVARLTWGEVLWQIVQNVAFKRR